MLKYGRRGAPKKRHIFLKDKMVCWQEPTNITTVQEKSKKKKDNNKDKQKKVLYRSIPVLDITDIKMGRDSSVFNRYKLKKESDMYSFIV